MRGQEDHLLARFHNALLHSACKDITDTLDFVNTRNWHPHWGTRRALWHTEETVEAFIQGLNVYGLFANSHIHTLPPRHVVRLLKKIVTHPARNWKHWSVL